MSEQQQQQQAPAPAAPEPQTVTIKTPPTTADAPAPVVSPKPEGGHDKFYDAKTGTYNWEAHAREVEYRSKNPQAPKQPTQEPPKQPGSEQQEAAEQALQVAGLDMKDFSAEFSKDGKLSDASYKTLEEKGFPKAVVDTYIKGVQADAASAQALADADVNEVKAVAGGEEGYKDLITWAAQNLSPEEIDAFNGMTGNKAQAKIAVAGLKARMEAAEGREPSLVAGEKPSVSGDVFRSRQEVTAAMRDERYKKGDKAYHAEFDAKMRRSSVFLTNARR